MPVPEMKPEAPKGESESKLLPIDPKVPPAAQALIRVCRKVMMSEKGEDALMRTLSGANSLPHAAAMVIFSLIQRGLESTGPIPPDVVFADEGVTDYLMDLLFALAQQNEVPGSDDQQQYVEAMNIVDEFGGQLMSAENGMPPEGDPNLGANAPNPGPQPPNGAPAPLMAS